MEIIIDDLTIGYQQIISFANFQNDKFENASTFKAMATQDGTSYIIIYQWSDPSTKTFNDREEAFYIDGINESNVEKAKGIFFDVFNGLQNAFKENPNQKYDITELVNNVIKNYSESKKR